MCPCLYLPRVNKPLGEMIRFVRERRGMTQAQLAKAAGLTRVTVTRLEGGRLASIRFTDLTRLSAALSVPAAVLFMDADPSTSTAAPDENRATPTE